MGQYCEGFVTARKDSDIITGIGTRFLSNVKQNDKIIIKLSDTTTTDIFTISGIASDTELTISTPFPNDYTFRAKYAIQSLTISKKKSKIINIKSIATSIIISFFILLLSIPD